MHDPFGKTVVGELVIQMFLLWDIETHSKILSELRLILKTAVD